MKLAKNDFVEIEFTGKVKDGDIFDTNISEEAKKLGIDIKSRPAVLCVGQNMILPAIDKFLEGKEVGKFYSLELSPGEGFGLRKRELLRTVPMKVFHEQKINPQPGMVFSIDNQPARVSAVSGGRVIVDFNSPLAGKDLVYGIEVKNEVSDINKKVSSLINFFFKDDFKFEIKEKKIILDLGKGQSQMSQFVNIFSDKFKDILGMALEAKASKEEKKSEEKAEEKKVVDAEETESKNVKK